MGYSLAASPPGEIKGATVSLRQGAIEASAVANHARWHKDDLGPCDMCRVEASVSLNAILDYLEANGTEWRRQAFDDSYYNNPGTEIPALIAALRMQENQP
jgi:hypothetical protein